MLDWFKKRFGHAKQSPTPPWRQGQYVTYFLERSDGSWTAMAMHLRGRLKDGGWVLSADFKTCAGECTAWFRSDPAAAESAVDPVPGRVERIRGGAPRAGADVKELMEDPEMQTA